VEIPGREQLENLRRDITQSSQVVVTSISRCSCLARYYRESRWTKGAEVVKAIPCTDQVFNDGTNELTAS
jgi:hypothetical protein